MSCAFVVLWVLATVALWFRQNDLIFPAPEVALGEPRGTARLLGFRLEHVLTSDGLHLAFWAAFPAPGKPIVLVFHGNGQAASDETWPLLPVRRAGYGVVLAEYRGYSGNPGRPSERGLVRDAEAYDAWAESRSTSLPVVLGVSLGTGVAVALAAERRVRGVVLDSPFTSIPDVVSSSPFLVDAAIPAAHKVRQL